MNFGMDNSGARAYTDNPTLGNNFYYRGKYQVTVTNFLLESEAHAKVTADALHLRDNDEIGPRLFTDVHQELCYCEEYQKKTYTSE
jgi:hypothetical protein